MMSFSKTIALATGILTIQIQASPNCVDQYIGFAARNNPKRGFLFISKVLGKHYPCKPSAMLASYQALADLLLPYQSTMQQCVFMAMAETATGLGAGVYENWLKQTPKKALYCQSTRYFLADQPYLDFEEAHSHARDFYLYWPQDTDLKHIFQYADTLVLIDDEISTGNTFANLILAYRKVNPLLNQVFVLSLLNVSDAATRETVARKTGCKIYWLSLLTGTYDFAVNPNFAFQPPNVVGSSHCKKAVLPCNFGRLGIAAPLPDFSNQLNDLTHTWQAGDSVLVLGTGELIYPAYLLGADLERQGFEVFVQSTTRSPILVGAAIADCLTFRDNYGDGIPNFLYNRHLHNYQHILVCHETEKNNEINALCAILNATSVQVKHGTVCISRP